MSAFPHYKQPDSKDCGPSCSYMTGRGGDGDPIGRTHVSKKEAKHATINGSWCCESCSTASWIEMNGDYMMLN